MKTTFILLIMLASIFVNAEDAMKIRMARIAYNQKMKEFKASFKSIKFNMNEKSLQKGNFEHFSSFCMDGMDGLAKWNLSYGPEIPKFINSFECLDKASSAELKVELKNKKLIIRNQGKWRDDYTKSIGDEIGIQLERAINPASDPANQNK